MVSVIWATNWVMCDVVVMEVLSRLELPEGGGSVPPILALARSPQGRSRMVGLDPTKLGWGWVDREKGR